MKRLILVRHAKSSWSDNTLNDKDRPLNDRGNADALKIGKWLAARGLQPDQVMASTALRCRETWNGLAKGLGPVADVAFLDLLYLATDREMLEILHTATGETVLMLGHMPGIGDFARDLRQDPPPMHDLFRKYPTGSVSVLNLHIDDWSQVHYGDADFETFATPDEM